MAFRNRYDTFQLERVQRADFSAMLTPSHRRGGDLTTPFIDTFWPVESGDEEGALRRLEYSVNHMKAFFESDPTAHLIKAVDRDGEIAGVIRWNFFPRGYDPQANEVVDVGQFLPQGWEERVNIALWRDLRQEEMKCRQEWMPQGRPCWIGMSMVVRPCYRKHGLGTLLVNWGVERAKRDHVPAYVEASSDGQYVFRKLGFQQIGDLWSWDCKPYGVDLFLQEARMAYYPKEMSGKEKLVSQDEDKSGYKGIPHDLRSKI